MSDHPIARILHISDLHFGKKLQNREKLWHKLASRTLIQATYHHDYQATRALQRIFHEIITATEAAAVPLLIVHTGDLTSSGKQAEFQTGETFLCSLGPVHEVPGNHDKWTFAKGQPPAWHRTHFPNLDPIPCLNGQITLFRLDSNKLKPDARGEVPASALDTLCAQLAADAAPIRIVLMHHPLHVEAPHDDSLLRLANRQEIAKRLAAAGANLVLTGHVHVSQYEPQPCKPMHFIAGSAAQMGRPKSFLVIDVYSTGFDVQELVLGPDNHFQPKAG